jgi:alanine dehydrogenase
MAEKDQPKQTKIASEFALYPEEEPAEVQQKPNKLFIGIPKEKAFQENRVPLTPETVSILINNGHRIIIESRAGEGSHFTDAAYEEAGAEVVANREKVFEANIIIQVTPPNMNELDNLHSHQTLISPIHLPTLTGQCVKSLMQKRISALAFEYIKDDGNTFPFVRSMSEIAGSAVILQAAELLSGNKDSKGILFGGISGVPPVKVLILGAGMVGESATRAALGLGAEVRLFDNNVYKLMRLQNHISSRLHTSFIYPEILKEEMRDADVVIGAIHSEFGRSPLVVTEEMINGMKKGSIVMDVSIDQGGCFETSEVTTHDHPTFTYNDIIHYGVPNIPSRVSRTASYAISNILSNILIKASNIGGFERLLQFDQATRHGVYIYKGRLTNQYLGEKFGIHYTDMDLLFASNI